MQLQRLETPWLKYFFMWKVIFEKKNSTYTSHWKIPISCTTKECYNVTTSYNPIFALLSVKWSLTQGEHKQNFKLFIVKWLQSLMRGGRLQEVTIQLFELETCGIFENWSLWRGGCNQRVDCINWMFISSFRFFASKHTAAARKVLSQSHHPHFW